MSWFTAGVVYVLIWWITVFAVLPIGIHPVAEPDRQTGWRGAPAQTRILRVVLITTLVTTALWGAAMLVILHRDWLSFRSGWLALPQD